MKKIQKIKSIPGGLIYNYYQRRCPYEVKLFFQGEKPQRESRQLNQYFIQRGLDREEEYFHLLKDEFGEDCAILEADPSLSFEEDMQKRARETEECMARGTSLICHGMFWQKEGLIQFGKNLQKNYPSLNLVPLFRGEPDILFKREGTSRFGDYLYEVGDVKSSYRSKFCQQMQVTYYSFLLEDIQGVLPFNGYIITQSHQHAFGMESFEMEDTIWTLRHFLEEELWEWLLEEEVFFHLTPRCQGCAFFQRCAQEAREQQDVSLIPGLSRSQKKALIHGGFSTLQKLAQATSHELGKVHFPGVGTEGLLSLSRQAKALVSQRPLYKMPKISAQKAAEELTLSVQLDQGYHATGQHFDFEGGAQPLFFHLTIDEYLGQEVIALKVDDTLEFYSSLEDFPQKTEGFLEKLVQSLREKGDFILVHYGGDPADHLQKVVETQELSFQIFLQEFLSFRLLDLKKLLPKVLALPVYSLDLSEVVGAFEEASQKKQPSFFTEPDFFSNLSLDLSWDEILGGSSSLYLRLYRETNHRDWLSLLRWREEESVRAICYLYETLGKLEEVFPFLREAVRE